VVAALGGAPQHGPDANEVERLAALLHADLLGLAAHAAPDRAAGLRPRHAQAKDGPVTHDGLEIDIGRARAGRHVDVEQLRDPLVDAEATRGEDDVPMGEGELGVDHDRLQACAPPRTTGARCAAYMPTLGSARGARDLAV